jgi:hypothetical protein
MERGNLVREREKRNRKKENPVKKQIRPRRGGDVGSDPQE